MSGGWFDRLRARRGRLLALVAALLGLLLLAGALQVQRMLDRPLNLPPEGLTFEVPSGSSVGQLATRLAEQGVLDAPRLFVVYARVSGYAPRLKAGEYRLAAGTSARALLEQWAAGRVVLYDLTLVEGWTFREAFAAVQAHPKLRATLGGLDEATIMARLGHPGEHPEGRFFPDTYRFAAGTTDLEFLGRAYRTMQQRLDEVWTRRRSDLPLASPDEVLILASIIEKETAVPDEYGLVAGVFVNRLRRGMLLQTDPTVIYALTRGQGPLGRQLLRRDLEVDDPYNTYVHAGLPPGPIANPGRGALEAAVAPAETDYLYFVADGTGGHAFAKSLAEHNRNVAKWRKVRDGG